MALWCYCYLSTAGNVSCHPCTGTCQSHCDHRPKLEVILESAFHHGIKQKLRLLSVPWFKMTASIFVITIHNIACLSGYLGCSECFYVHYFIQASQQQQQPLVILPTPFLQKGKQAQRNQLTRPESKNLQLTKLSLKGSSVARPSSLLFVLQLGATCKANQVHKQGQVGVKNSFFHGYHL